MSITLQQIEVPSQRRLHVDIAVNARAFARAEKNDHVEIGNRGEFSKERVLILDDVRGDDGEARHQRRRADELTSALR